ncbi:MAG TPA: aminotransferase class III-fold pyridoxal phosphate-dependent enzyme, partial [Ornithinibacter sp.]|nr:aminotransferase class III-fold pyridoxal phosphate-dependent enzyme [Ornithinibacter sp.]
LAERLLSLAQAPRGSAVFFCNSGTEALEAAIKLARRTGRTGIVAAEGAFHGRSTGALALTHKPAYREPFEPLIPGVSHVPWGDVDALRAAVTEETSALVLEPIQGEAGVRPAGTAYLRVAREVTREAGALLVLDEVQTGVGRTGSWFAFQQAGVVPDAMTLAKGLGGGVPIGALVTFGTEVSAMLTPGMHGSTFGGNPLACAAGLAVLDTIESQGLLAHTVEAGHHLERRVLGLGHPMVTGVRGAGLLRAITLAAQIAPAVAALALEAGFIVNPVAPDALRLAPPLVVTTAQIDLFVDALPGLLDTAAATTSTAKDAR